MHRSISFRRRLAGAAALSLSHVLMAGPAIAQAGEALEVSVPAAPLGEALRAFSEQTGLPVVFSEALVQGKVSAGAGGVLTAGGALDALLQGTGLEAVPGGGGFIIRERRGGEAAPAPVPAGPPDLTRTEEQEPPAPRREAEQRLGQVTVTGTSLRGIAPESSPLQIYSREDILGSGVTTTEQFIRSLPQNFGGGSSEFARNGLPNDESAVLNYSFGTGANLRGLGSGATLILLNGQRLAPTSAIADFVDLSMIPVSALDRVDVLTDGASSIYGGDAVAGVINFVLRDDFEGGETALRVGTVTEGEMKEYRLSQSLGKRWASGNVLATYEYFNRDNLTLADRPAIALPRLANGDPIPTPELFDLMPAQKRHSGLLAVNQDLSPSISVFATGLFSKRDTKHSGVNYTGLGLLVDSDARSESAAINAGGSYILSDTWSASLTANYSEIVNATSTRSSNQPLPAEFDFSSDIGSVDFVLSGSLLPLPAGPVRVAAGGHFRQENFSLSSAAGGLLRKGERDVYAVYGEMHVPVFGAGNRRPGLERLEINLSGRLDDYSDFGSSGNPKIGLIWAPAESLRLRSSFSESFTPPPLGYTGDRSTTGVILPTSFVTDAFGLAGQYPELDGTDLLIVLGTSDELEPQTSRTFTAGLEFDRSWASTALSGSIGYYDIDFEQRLGRVPVPGNLDPSLAPFIAYDDPSAFPSGTVIFNPSQAEVERLVNAFDRPVDPRLGATIGNVGIINNASVRRNLASTRTRGLDIRADYTADAGTGTLSAGVNVNYILGFTQQAATTTPEVEVLDTLFNPVDLQARAHLAWAQGSFSGRAVVNYTDSYRTDSTNEADRMPSWTTADIVASFAFDGTRHRLLDRTEISLSVINLFDEPPPAAPSVGRLQIAGYDPTNASPLGRFIALELRKAF